MHILLDTNICIYLIKNQPKKIREKFNTLDIGDIGISSITLSELTYGVEKSQHREKNMCALEQLIFPLEISNYDEKAAYHYGKIRAHLQQKGQLIGPLDMMIAAHSRSLGCTLITNNTKEFKRVPNLSVENWI